MDKTFRLLYSNSTPANQKRVKKYLDQAGISYLIEFVPSLEEAWNELNLNKYDLALVDALDDLNRQVSIFREANLPVIVIVDKENEQSAVEALERGLVEDYVLCSPAGLKRLHLLIRAVIARKVNRIVQMAPDLERLRFLAHLEVGYDAFVIVDKAGKVVFNARESVFWSGYSNEELKDLNPLELIHNDDAETVIPLFMKLVATPGSEKSARVRILHKNGHWHWYDVAAVNMLEAPLVQGILIQYSDVSKRKQDAIQQDAVYRIAQAALASESLEDLFASLHMIISEVMPAGNFYLAIYDSANNLLEFPYYVDEFDNPPIEPAKLGHGLTEYVIRSGKSLLCTQEKFDELKAKGEVDLVGSPFAIWLGVPLLIGGRVVGVMTVQHYNEMSVYGERELRMLEFVSSQVASAIYRKQVETGLRESEERFRSLFENATAGIYRSTPDGELLLANPAVWKMTGFDSLEDAQSVDLEKDGFVNPADRKRFREILQRKGEIIGYESIWKKKDGSPVYLRESARLFENPETGQVHYEGIVEDVTERKLAELALEQKVIALETLADIDTEILSAKNPEALLNLVCRRAVGLLKASKSCIVSFDKTGENLLAVHGFQDVKGMESEFSSDANLGLFNKRQSFSIRDITSKNFRNVMSTTRKVENVRSVIAEAFGAENEFRAIFAVFDEVPRNWTADDQQLLSFLAGQVALSLEKARLLHTAEYRAQNFEMLYSLASDIASQRELEAVLNLIVESALHLFNIQCGFVYLYDTSNNELELTIVRGVDLKPGYKLKIGDGLAGMVARSKKPKLLDDYSIWSHQDQNLDKFDFSVTLSVPMIYGGDLIGVLELAERGDKKRAITDDEVQLLSLFAGQAASAVFNARLFSQLQKRNEELDRLYRSLGLLIAGVSTDRSSLCQHISEIILSEFDQSNCCVWLIDEHSERLERYGASGKHVDEMSLNKLTMDGRGLIPKSIREVRIINVSDVRVNADYEKSWDDAISELIIPLIVDDEVIGVIDLQSTEPSAFNEDDERLMGLFALRAALMLDHVRLIEQTEEKNLRLSTLHTIEASLASSLDLRITLSSLVDQVQTRLKVDAVSVSLFDKSLQTLEYLVGRGFHQSGLENYRIRIGDGIPGRAALNQEVIYTPDLSKPAPVSKYPERIATESFISSFAVPLVAKGQLYGVMELFFRRLVYNDPEWIEYLETLARQVAMAIDGIYVFEQLQQSLLMQQIAQDATIESWSKLLEMRGLEPKGHAQRVSEATLNLAQRMGINDSKLVKIYRGVLLHDIGKLLIPDTITHKREPLTDDEWKIIRQHPIHAYELLSNIEPFKDALQIPYCHHEAWDGSGYPRGLRGDQIPIEARIFQVIDTWDLMLVDLPYRRAQKEQNVLKYIRSQVGKKFDPVVVEEFFRMISFQA